MQRMAHPDGECANARAAARMGTVFTLSTIATSSIEQISSIEGLHFFQLYIYKDSITQLPIVLKGVLTPEAAIKGVNSGAAAIWVSNHGARQIDTVSSTTTILYQNIDVLPEIVAAVGNKCEVFIDGGFRTGTDVYKALALGAKMVFLGRPLIWGLACGGEEGAYQVLNIMKTELESTMINSGNILFIIHMKSGTLPVTDIYQELQYPMDIISKL
ncbi:Hydroxyacid oxidase 2 [Armadillidium vulgare]|nr:Hydroxyacid oxidase 2 [Armadillidium vulgare]